MTLSADRCLPALALVAGFVVFEPRRQGSSAGAQASSGSSKTSSWPAPRHSASTGPWRSSRRCSCGGGLVVRRCAWSGERRWRRQAARTLPVPLQAVPQQVLPRRHLPVDRSTTWSSGSAKFIAFFDRAVVNDTGINGPGEVADGIGFAAQASRRPASCPTTRWPW